MLDDVDEWELGKDPEILVTTRNSASPGAEVFYARLSNALKMCASLDLKFSLQNGALFIEVHR